MARVSQFNRAWAPHPLEEQRLTRGPAHFLEADVRRACKAAPDRPVEIHLPDGTIIRLLPGGKGKAEVAEKKEVRL
jgi:hypothetical protein